MSEGIPSVGVLFSRIRNQPTNPGGSQELAVKTVIDLVGDHFPLGLQQFELGSPHVQRSEWHKPENAVRNSTSCGPGFLTSTLSITSGLFAS